MYRTAEDWEYTLGQQIRSYRLAQNMSQSDMANRLDLSIGTVARLEAGKGSSLSTFIKVVQFLGKTPWLDSFSPQVKFSPLQQLELGKQRERASKSKTRQEKDKLNG